MADKYNAGAPPAYVPGGSPSPYPPQPAHITYSPQGHAQDYYGSAAPQGYQQGPPQGYQQGPPQGYHQGPPMGYQQQGHPPQGQFVDERRNDSGSSGCLAGLCAALACCCCLDCLF